MHQRTFWGEKKNRLPMLRLLPGPIQKMWVSLIGKFHIAKGCLDKKHYPFTNEIKRVKMNRDLLKTR